MGDPGMIRVSPTSDTAETSKCLFLRHFRTARDLLKTTLGGGSVNRRRVSSVFAVVSVLGLSVMACSSAEVPSEYDEGAPTPTGSNAPSDSFDKGGGSSSGDSGAGTIACASSAVEAALSPITLVFMIDKSGSMGEDTAKKTTKWDPVVAGLKAFFTSPDAKGVSASLGYFPEGDPDDSGYCKSSTYEKAKFAKTALPSAPLASSIDAISPTAEGTPGAPALRGALDLASKTAASTKQPAAVVFVTDGDPNKCDSTPAAVAAIASAYKATVKTYVIGIGNVATLNQVAVAGGTTAAQIVAIGSPTKTKDDFLKTLSKIRGAELPCELSIPKPPAGQTLDYAKVNLSLDASGKKADLAQGADCSSGAGWRYDDPKSPTKILLCPSTCDAAKGGGKLAVSFGCATKTNVQ